MAKITTVREAKLTYFSNKKVIRCPICNTLISREEILSGSGRLIAGELTDELHRTYEKTQKFGYVYPLAYSVIVCPECFYATLATDFEQPPRDEVSRLIKNSSSSRYSTVSKIFPHLNFSKERTLSEAVASYLLALLCYELLPKEYAPTFKMGLCSLRAAWLATGYHLQEPKENYNYLAAIVYRKASFYYRKAIELEDAGDEFFSSISYLGPDQDNNYGFEGVQYLSSLLEFKYGSQSNKNIRANVLKISQFSISKIFGMGKASKSKPSAILELTRRLYEKIKAEQTNLNEQGFA